MVPQLLSGCTQVPIKDEIVYGNKGMLGSIEFHTLTTETREVTFQEWMQIIRDNPLVCTSVTAFGDVKTELEQLCSVTPCSPDVASAIEQFSQNLTKAHNIKIK
jgi:hypothetical protein